LRRAGASLIGHCNMSEFAFSGVGINPHYGTPRNPATVKLDKKPRIPGGSTSGGAVSVAGGAAWATLGSDTGGSIRIPAALQGLVGFKNTKRLTPLDGAIPLSQSLDTACAITLSVRDAVLLHEVLSGTQVQLAHRPLRQRRFAVARELMQDGMDGTVAAAFGRTLAQLREAGAQIEEVSIAPLLELGRLLARGSLPAAESWAWHRQRISAREADYDPRVVQRIRTGERMSAADYIDVINGRSAWIMHMQAALQGFDAVLSPTVPIVAPEIAPLVASDEHFFAANSLLLRNTAVVNMLDGCALSLPCHTSREMPVGLMVWSTALQDDTVLDAALQIETALAPLRQPAMVSAA
ncbi:MAG: amidase, partial [Burkholderiaceae bacterium]|nr:amidase [Burkholderiaceae bacterium]